MKKINLLFLLWTVVVWGTKAQTFGISGQVVDSLSNEPLPYSVIQLVGPDGKAWFNGVVTNEDATFFFKGVEWKEGEAGRQGCFLLVTHLGYGKKQIPLEKDGRSEKINFGTIGLKNEAQAIGEVVVTAGANRQYVDKKKYAVTESLLANVAVSTDLFRKIPELAVDELLRTVTIKGKSNVLVLVNGVNTEESVDIRTINFRDVESVEVITTPPSGADVQYDGIINIVLKTSVRQGFSIDSEATAMANGHSADGYVGLLFGRDKVRANLSYTTRYRAIPFRLDRTRENEEAGMSYREEGYCADPFELSHNVLFNMDYHMTSRDFFNITTSTRFFRRDRTVDNVARMIEEGRESDPAAFSTRNKADITTGNYTLFYRRQGAKPEDYLSVNMNIHFNRTTYDTRTEYTDGRTWLNKEPSDKRGTNVKVEYNRRITGFFRVNVGGQWYFQDYNGTLNNRIGEGSFKNHRYNGYADLYFAFGSSQFLVGFKAEGNRYDFKKAAFGSTSRSIVQPQASWNHKINKAHSITLSYRRRPYYPAPWQLAPYEVQTDDKTIMKGNPALEPQVYDLLEFYYFWNPTKAISVRMSPYWNHCGNAITSLPSFDAGLVSTTMPANTGRYDRTGLKLDASIWLMGFLQIEPEFDLFYEKVKTPWITSDAFAPRLGGTLMVWLPAGFGVGAYGSYYGKRAIEGGYRKPKYSVDAVFLMKRFEKIRLNLFAGYQYAANSAEITDTYSDFVWERTYYKSEANGFIFRANFYFDTGRKSKMERVKTYFDTTTRE